MDAEGYNKKVEACDRIKQLQGLVCEKWCDVDDAAWAQLVEGLEKKYEGGSFEECKEEYVLGEIGQVFKRAIKKQISDSMRIS